MSGVPSEVLDREMLLMWSRLKHVDLGLLEIRR